MQLLPLPRLGAAHGTAQTGQVQGQALASASHIRQLVHTQGIKAASPFVPQATMELYRQAAEQGQLADPEKFSTAVLTLLRTKTPEQLSTLRGAGEGLENRLYAAAREAETVNDLYDRLKTKRYPRPACGDWYWMLCWMCPPRACPRCRRTCWCWGQSATRCRC